LIGSRRGSSVWNWCEGGIGIDDTAGSGGSHKSQPPHRNHVNSRRLRKIEPISRLPTSTNGGLKEGPTMTCPNCHHQATLDQIWQGVKRCLYCGVLLLSTFSPGQISPQQQPAPELRYFVPPIIAANTTTTAVTTTVSFPNKSG